MFKNPDLLKRRLNAKEKEGEQKTVIALSGLMFMAGFVIAGLNYRFAWVVLPNIVTIIASIVFVISYILYAEVLRENAYLLRTIEVEKGQKVVDTGMYGIVRHPMYIVTILLFGENCYETAAWSYRVSIPDCSCGHFSFLFLQLGCLAVRVCCSGFCYCDHYQAF